MRYVLDTNVLLFYVRDKNTRSFLEKNYAPFGSGNESIISIVSIAEIYSLAARYNWGVLKQKAIEKLIDDSIVIEIRYRDLIDMYVEIETFSNKSNTKRVRKGSAVKMGKNDLWIAATAMVTSGTLITSDTDFDHLNGELIDVLTYSPQD
ncbi:MAG: type II toxin-antitoxin system VapC family toxin [Bacteroidota bacterium]